MDASHAQPHRRWRQISLREFVLAITLICFGFGWLQEHNRRVGVENEMTGFSDFTSILAWADRHPKQPTGNYSIYVRYKGQTYDVALQCKKCDQIFTWTPGFGR